MSNMFNNCKNLEKINFGVINSSPLIKMEGLFESCSKLESIDFSKFHVLKVKEMKMMFYYCKNLKTIYVFRMFKFGNNKFW